MQPGSRSWTDTTTNSIFYHGLDATAYLRWLARRDVRADHLVPQFLHEFTHHWCFQSLVGATLALTELRLSIFMEAYPTGRPIWARDLVAHRCLSNLLRPIAEGMAQVAEFDLTHIDDDFHPATPLGVATLCFSPGAEDVFRLAMVQFLRHSPEVLERKASLYLRPFEVTDGYLPGYLATKNIAWSLIGRGYNVPMEVLLAYVRSYFWDDPVYTSLVISEEFDGGKVATALSRRFRERFLQLLTATDLPERIDSFWPKWSPSPGASRSCAAELEVPGEEFDMALTRLGQLEAHYLDLVERDPEAVERVSGLASGQLAQLLHDLAHARQYAVIATAQVTIDDTGTVDTGAQPPFQFEPRADLPAGRYRLSAIVPTAGSALALVAQSEAGDARLLTSWTSRPNVPVDEAALVRFTQTLAALTSTMHRLRGRALTAGLAVVDSPVLIELAREMREDALDVYTVAATARIDGPRETIETVRASLRREALKPVFRNNVTAIRLVAGMSMLSGTMQQLEMSAYGLVSFAHLYFLPEVPTDELRELLDWVAANDPHALVLRIIDDRVVFFV